MCCSSIARPATYRSPTQVSVSSPDSARHLLRSPTSRTNWANSLPSSPERCGSTRMQRLRSRCWHRWCSNSWRRFLTCRRNRQRAPTRRHRRKRVRLRHPFQRDYLGGHGGNSGRADAAAYRRRRTVVCCRPSPIAIAGPAEWGIGASSVVCREAACTAGSSKGEERRSSSTRLAASCSTIQGSFWRRQSTVAAWLK